MTDPARPPFDPTPYPGAAYPHPAAAPGVGRGAIFGTDPRQKSPLLATVLSIMPGLGQVYTGYYQRGFFNASVVAVLITLLAAESTPGALIPLLAILLAFFWLYNVVDAGRRATLYNMVLQGGGEIDLPRDFDMPGMVGSIPGGLAIIAAGAILLAHTAFGYSLEWVADWWPAGLVIFGGYLVWKAAREKARAAANGERS
ncbi:MAG TPA: hypothetical protein VGV61_06655 [Thermoanaerobaculia bacterium]|nr:hypothetical protein [Thermoanaerobaculia bacterium]